MEKPWLSLYPVDLGEEPLLKRQSLVDVLHETVSLHPTYTALTFMEKTWSYAELWQLVKQTAGALHADGFEKGDRMAVMLPNVPHFMFSIYGGLYAGGVSVQVNPMYVGGELQHVLSDTGATHIVILGKFYPILKSIRARTGIKRAIVVNPEPEQTLDERDVVFEQFVGEASPLEQPVSVNPEEDLAVIQYTGGTTGVPKGAMLTHMNLVANVEQVYDFMYRYRDDVPENMKSVSALPLFHIFGLTCCNFLAVKLAGNQLIVPKFELDPVVALLNKHKPYQFAGVPTMYVAFNNGQIHDVSGLQAVTNYISGGASIPLETMQAFKQLSGKQIHEGYGLSETSPVTHFNPSFLEAKPGSIGLPAPRTEAKLVEKTDNGYQEVPRGEAGELAIKGPQVMKGYWKKETDTEIAFHEDWFLTGDMGKLDEQGYFYIVDRKKDMINASGFNVYPREVEEVIYEHPAVQEVSVIGVPDAYRGETVKAFVVLREGHSLDEEALALFCGKRLAAFKVPKLIEFRDSLPKSAVGKLLKRKLREEETREPVKRSN